MRFQDWVSFVTESPQRSRGALILSGREVPSPESSEDPAGLVSGDRPDTLIGSVDAPTNKTRRRNK